MVATDSQTTIDNPFRKNGEASKIPSDVPRFVSPDSEPLSSSVADSSEEEVQMGSEMAAMFKDAGVHPIFIFGSKGSGKTSLIASLIKYMRDKEEAEATIELAEEIFPQGDPRWNRRRSWARDVFHRKVLDYIERQAPATTQEEEPFFIPIRLELKAGKPVYFAFLEGKGEWYQPDRQAEIPYRKFKGFVQGVLQSFNESATVIYVAPFVSGSTDEGAKERQLRDSDLGLLGAINEYTSARRAMYHQDKHLFLLTKWDIFCHLSSDRFTDPDGEAIQSILKERYPISWIKFGNMNMSEHMANKSYSTYSAGVIDGRNIAAPAEEDEERVAFYPRKLWDELYQNATGKVLYEDVQPPKPGLLDRLIGWLRT